MNEIKIKVENIKCGGCANSIRKIIDSVDNTYESNIDIETQTISIKGRKVEDTREEIISKLANAGYPLHGTGTGFQKAKSFVSCMIGRVS